MTSFSNSSALSAALDTLAGKLEQFVFQDVDCSLPLGSVRLIRRQVDTRTVSVMNQPAIALIVSGAKRAELPGGTLTYGKGSVFICSLDTPDSFVVLGTSLTPFIAISMSIDEARVNRALSLLAGKASSAEQTLAGPAAVYPADLDLVRAFDALFEAEWHKAQHSNSLTQALLALREDEIVLRALTGPVGGHLRALFHAGTPENRIRRVVIWLRTNFKESFSIETLARLADMSPATFHRHFQSVLGISPRRYITMLRLFEGRRLIQEEGYDAAAASYAVGYASTSYFSRAYKSFFGAPPLTDSAASAVNPRAATSLASSFDETLQMPKITLPT